MKNEKKVFGTYEWAVTNANYISGCSNNCKYCYSREMAIRFKRKTSANWHIEEVNQSQFNKKFRKVDGFIMFPSSHDITPKHLNQTIIFLEKLLVENNHVLIVTKPHFKVIEAICDKFQNYKNNILFRFTIGSCDSNILKFWEPDAPSYNERKKCLIYAYNNGYATSISCEPILDNKTESLVKDLEEYITNFIWIGKANFLLRRLKMNGVSDKETIDAANKLIASQSNNSIKKLYKVLEDNPKIKWKESIKRILNIEVATIKGLDE